MLNNDSNVCTHLGMVVYLTKGHLYWKNDYLLHLSFYNLSSSFFITFHHFSFSSALLLYFFFSFMLFEDCRLTLKRLSSSANKLNIFWHIFWCNLVLIVEKKGICGPLFLKIVSSFDKRWNIKGIQAIHWQVGSKILKKYSRIIQS